MHAILKKVKTDCNEQAKKNVLFISMTQPRRLYIRFTFVVLVKESRHRNDWPIWKEVIEEKLNSLAKHEVFGPVVYTPKNIIHVGYKWVFVRKKINNNEIVQYKA